MKATGIVRRIDELGRVVIPKEIRRTLRIREGDPLEIYTDKEGGVVLKKYSLIGNAEQYAKEFADSLYHSTGHTALIADKDVVLAAAGSGKKDLGGKTVSIDLMTVMDNRRSALLGKGGNEKVISLIQEDKAEDYTAQCILPILSGGDVLGAVVLVSRESGAVMTQTDQKIGETIAYFLGSQVE